MTPPGPLLLTHSFIPHFPILSIPIPSSLFLLILIPHPPPISQPYTCITPPASQPLPPSISSPHLPSLPLPLPPAPIALPPSCILPSESTFPPQSFLPQGPHLHWLLSSPLIVFCLFMLPTSLGQVGVVGKATEQGGHHGAGVHLLLWREGGSFRTLRSRGGSGVN